MEVWLRGQGSRQLRLIEAVLYLAVGILLILAAAAAAAAAGIVIWHGMAAGTISDPEIMTLDRLLLVLMLVEILHTVRISISSQELFMEPFLIVGIIASIRRILVITMQAAKFTEEGHQTPDAVITFRNSMIELAVLGVLILIFVVAISMLRRSRSRSRLSESIVPRDRAA